MLTEATHARDGSGAAAPDVFARALARFGHDSLRPGQADVIRDIFDGKQVIAVMPTGAGKSLCYQLPAIAFGERGGVTLVVSPLIALMKDQVDTLRARGIPAVALTSQANPEEQRDILEGIRGGVYTLVYVAPERFRSPRFVDALRATADKLQFIAIDEAHCISEWGHDFRPDYRRLGEVIRQLGVPRLAAFTATATPEVRADIAVQLGFDDPQLHVRGFDRPNLRYEVMQAGNPEDKSTKLIDLVRTREGGVALVYAATRKNAEKLAKDLKTAGMRARVYHAGLQDAVRETAQDVFMSGQLDVIVATNAFGMGVDKSDIRLVVHADIPRSPEAYYQEAGRGGRDGKPTRCVLLFNHGDIRLQEFLIDASFPSADVLRGLWKLLRDRPELGKRVRGEDSDDELEARLKRNLGEGNASNAAIGAALRILEKHGMLRWHDDRLLATRPDPDSGTPPLDVAALARRAAVETKKLKTMVEYAYYPRCRRQFVLEYFGDLDWRDRERKCGACDKCEEIAHSRATGRSTGLSKTESEAIRAILLLVGGLQGRFGRTRVAALATGSETDPKFHEVTGRACVRGWPDRQVMDLLRALEGAGLVEASRGEYPTIATTRKGDQVAAGHLDPGDLGVQMPAVSKRVRKPSKPRSRFK
ncbi:MAG: RecQ family ATP-dependent DNA helicase [Deltaproteobacteria bacterium]|nr:RecQ family ATP-dependent DNA helicase [Deltaproteobacteria bacterium]